MKAKTTLPPLITGLSLLWVASHCLAEEKKAAPAPPVPAPKEQKVEVTGSYIKRPLDRAGRVTDAPFQLVIIDRQTIEQSGAVDVKTLLRRSGHGR